MPRDNELSEAIELLGRRLDLCGGDTATAYSKMTSVETAFIDAELSRCLDDPEYFIKNYCHLKSKDEGVILFDSWWESQEMIYAAAMHEKARRGMVKLAILKARQLGSSELCTALMFWNAMFKPGGNTLIMAQDPNQAGFLFDKCRMSYDMLPWWMRPELRYERKGQILEFDRKDADARRSNPGLRSSLFVDAATKMTGVAVGKGLKGALLSEVCWYPDKSILIDQVFPTLEGVTDQFSIMESTSMGEEEVWYDTYLACVDGDLDWRPVFIEAFRIKKYSIPLPKGETLALTKEEQAIKDRVLRERGVELTDAYLNWRRIKMRETEKMGDPEAFFRQYPGTTWTEAFTMSGDCAFDRKKLQYMLETQECTPKWAGEISLRSVGGNYTYKLMGGELSPGQTPQNCKQVGQRFRMWQEPDPDEKYYVAVDPSLGIYGLDFAAIQVLKIGRLHEPDEQVACWHGYESPTPTAAIAYAIGCLYATNGQEAQIAVEINGVGVACAEELHKKLEYPNPYRWQVSDKIRNSMTNFLGWKTTASTKESLVTRMREQVQTDSIIIHDRDTLLEMKAFSKDGERSFSGRGRKDDLCMSLMICEYCARQSEYGRNAASSYRKTYNVPGRYMQVRRGTCSTDNHTVTWTDGDMFDEDMPPGRPILIGKQWCIIERSAAKPAPQAATRTLVDGHWVTLPATDGDALPPNTITVRESLGRQDRVEWHCMPVRRDFYNTDFSPIYDRPGSDEHKLHVEHGVAPEDVKLVMERLGAPKEAIGDILAHVQEDAGSEGSEWMNY